MSEKTTRVKWCWRFQNKNPSSANGISLLHSKTMDFFCVFGHLEGVNSTFWSQQMDHKMHQSWSVGWHTKITLAEGLSVSGENFITQTRGGSTCCHTLKAVYSFCWFRTNASPVSSMVSCIDFMTPLFLRHVPGPLNNHFLMDHFLMDVWWSNHLFNVKIWFIIQSNWNNQLNKWLFLISPSQWLFLSSGTMGVTCGSSRGESRGLNLLLRPTKIFAGVILPALEWRFVSGKKKAWKKHVFFFRPKIHKLTKNTKKNSLLNGRVGWTCMYSRGVYNYMWTM